MIALRRAPTPGAPSREQHRRQHQVVLRLTGVKKSIRFSPLRRPRPRPTRRAEERGHLERRIGAGTRCRPTVLTPPNPATSKACPRAVALHERALGKCRTERSPGRSRQGSDHAASLRPPGRDPLLASSSSFRFRSMIRITKAPSTAPAYTMICRTQSGAPPADVDAGEEEEAPTSESAP